MATPAGRSMPASPPPSLVIEIDLLIIKAPYSPGVSTPTSPPDPTLSCACWNVRSGAVMSPHAALSTTLLATHTLVGAASAGGTDTATRNAATWNLSAILGLFMAYLPCGPQRRAKKAVAAPSGPKLLSISLVASERI